MPYTFPTWTDDTGLLNSGTTSSSGLGVAPQRPQANPFGYMPTNTHHPYANVTGSKPGQYNMPAQPMQSPRPAAPAYMGPGIMPPTQWRGRLPFHMKQKGWSIGRDGRWYPPGMDPMQSQSMAQGYNWQSFLR